MLKRSPSIAPGWYLCSLNDRVPVGAAPDDGRHGLRDQTALGPLVDDAPGARPDADGRRARGAGLQPARGRRVAGAAPGDGVAGVQALRVAGLMALSSPLHG